MRTPLIAANWKMHKTPAEGAGFVEAFRKRLAGPPPLEGGAAEIAIAPATAALDAVGRALAGSAIALVAQNVHAEDEGAFTGETSAPMLAALGCRYGLVGHSERRSLFGENDATVAAKLAALLRHGIDPILCVGETLEEREAGSIEAVIETQLHPPLDAFSSHAPAPAAARLVVAYEPVWAIGTGRTATPEIAQEVHAFIRGRLAEHFGDGAETIRILYGGSVKPENAAALLGLPDVDGALVGGASLDPDAFARIVLASGSPVSKTETPKPSETPEGRA